MIFIAYTTLFLDCDKCNSVMASGTSSLSTAGLEFGLGGPTLLGLYPGSWELGGLAKILAR